MVDPVLEKARVNKLISLVWSFEEQPGVGELIGELQGM